METKKPQVNSKSTGQPFAEKNLDTPPAPIKKIHLSEDSQQALSDEVCPFCDTDLDYGHTFQQEDGRQGGLMTCPFCKIRFAWIESPFECEIQEV